MIKGLFCTKDCGKKIAALLLGGAMIVSTGMVLTNQVNRLIKKQLTGEAALVAELSANRLSMEFDEWTALVKNISRESEIREYLADPSSKNLEPANSRLDQYAQFSRSQVCYLLDQTGRVLASSNRNEPENFIGQELAFRPYFQKALAKEIAWHYGRGVGSGIRGIYFSAPVMNSRGEVLGVAAIKISTTIFENELLMHREAFLVDENGVIFLSSDPEHHFNSLFPLSAKEKEDILVSNQYGVKDIDSLLSREQENSGEPVKLHNEYFFLAEQKIGGTESKLVVLKPLALMRLILIGGYALTGIILLIYAAGLIYFIQRANLIRRLVLQEQNYQRIFDLSEMGLLVHEAKTGRIIDVNKTACEIYGSSREQLLTQDVENISLGRDSFDQENALVKIKQAADQGLAGPFDWVARKRNGATFPARVTLRRFEINDKNMVLAMVQDMTQINAANKKIQDMAKFPEENPYPVFRLGSSGEVIYANPHSRKIFSENQSESGLRLPADLKAKILESLKNDELRSQSVVLGSRVFVLSFVPNIHSGHVTVYGVDITGLKNIEKKLLVSEQKHKNLAQDLSSTQEAVLNILEDLQEAKAVMEESRENFIGIVEKSNDGVIIVDAEDRILFANFPACVLFGSAREEMIGTKLMLGVDPEKTPETQIVLKNGEKRLVEIRVTRTQWDDKLAQLILIHDITLAREAETFLRNAAQEWRSTFDAIGDGVALLDPAGRILRMNESFRKIADLGFNEIIGRNCAELIAKDDTAISEFFARGAETKFRINKEVYLKGAWYNLSLDPIFNESGGNIGAVFAMSNITALRSREEELRSYTKFVENILDTAQAAIIVLNRDLAILSSNNFAENMLGYTKEEMVGQNWLDLAVPEELREEMLEVMRNCLEGQRMKGYEAEVLTKARKTIPVSWFTSELYDVKGRIIGVVSMGYDLTQRKDIEKVQRLAQLGTLVSHMAHEVNNPLMVISGRAQLTLMEEVSSEIKTNLEIIMKECQRAKTIIQRLLRFSRPSKGEIKSVDINQSLEEVVFLLEHQFGLSNIRIEKHLAPDLPKIEVDEKQIHEVVMNLFTNARDAIEGQGTIFLRTSLEDARMRIDVTDTGKGMDKATMAKVFDPFFTTKKTGSGLGLAICYGIIKAHSGELLIDSAPGKGTTMSIFLPLAGREENAENSRG